MSHVQEKQGEDGFYVAGAYALEGMSLLEAQGWAADRDLATRDHLKTLRDPNKIAETNLCLLAFLQNFRFSYWTPCDDESDELHNFVGNAARTYFFFGKA